MQPESTSWITIEELSEGTKSKLRSRRVSKILRNKYIYSYINAEQYVAKRNDEPARAENSNANKLVDRERPRLILIDETLIAETSAAETPAAGMLGAQSFQGRLSKAKMIVAGAREEAKEKEDEPAKRSINAAKSSVSEPGDDRDRIVSETEELEWTVGFPTKNRPNILPASETEARKPAAETSSINIQRGRETRFQEEILELEAIASRQPKQKRANPNVLSPSKDKANGLEASMWAPRSSQRRLFLWDEEDLASNRATAFNATEAPKKN